jgi:hypothetical protein
MVYGGFGVLGAYIGVTSFAMFYGFFEVLFRFVQMRAFASYFAYWSDVSACVTNSSA